MATLHIEHAITDLDTWMGAFTAFAEARKGAGVRAERIRRPAGDERFIVVDLDFDSVDAARASSGSSRRRSGPFRRTPPRSTARPAR